MAIDPDAYRDAVRFFASGVTVVTVDLDGAKHGMTASSFASISLDPPLIMVSLDRDSTTRAMVLAAQRFAVNILSDRQEAIAKSFSMSGRKDFTSIEHRLDDAGAPLLDGALATMSCEVREVYEAGDHDILIGTVLYTETTPGRPLIYFDRSYRRMA